MAQDVEQHSLLLDSGDSDSTDYVWITAGGASTITLIQQAVIVNNDAVAQTVTIKVKDTSGTAIFTCPEYSIAAGDSAFIAELCGQALNGDASSPETVTVQFDTALTASDTIDCLASAVKFS